MCCTWCTIHAAEPLSSTDCTVLTINRARNTKISMQAEQRETDILKTGRSYYEGQVGIALLR